MSRPTGEILDGLQADGILRVIAHAEIDPDAALFVLEDAADRVLTLLGPALVADDRGAPARIDWPALRGAAHLLAGALLVHQTARAAEAYR